MGWFNDDPDRERLLIKTVNPDGTSMANPGFEWPEEGPVAVTNPGSRGAGLYGLLEGQGNRTFYADDGSNQYLVFAARDAELSGSRNQKMAAPKGFVVYRASSRADAERFVEQNRHVTRWTVPGAKERDGSDGGMPDPKKWSRMHWHERRRAAAAGAEARRKWIAEHGRSAGPPESSAKVPRSAKSAAPTSTASTGSPTSTSKGSTSKGPTAPPRAATAPTAAPKAAAPLSSPTKNPTNPRSVPEVGVPTPSVGVRGPIVGVRATPGTPAAPPVPSARQVRRERTRVAIVEQRAATKERRQGSRAAIAAHRSRPAPRSQPSASTAQLVVPAVGVAGVAGAVWLWSQITGFVSSVLDAVPHTIGLMSVVGVIVYAVRSATSPDPIEADAPVVVPVAPERAPIALPPVPMPDTVFVEVEELLDRDPRPR